MKNAIEIIENLIKEHEASGYCTNYEEAEDCIEYDVTASFDKFYDVGRYETLTNLLNDIKNIGA